MKAYVFQPAYSMDFADSDALFQWELEQLDLCGEDADLIVLPEACDRFPALTMEQRKAYYRHRGDRIRDFYRKIAKENGLSFEVTELLFHAPFVEEYLEENIEIGEAKAIKVGNERKVN